MPLLFFLLGTASWRVLRRPGGPATRSGPFYLLERGSEDATKDGDLKIAATKILIRLGRLPPAGSAHALRIRLPTDTGSYQQNANASRN